MIRTKLIFFILILTLLNACDKLLPNSNNQIQETNIIEVDTIEQIVEEIIPEIIEPEKINYSLNILNDNIIFSELEITNIESEKYGVVGNNATIFYPFIELNTNDDLKNLTDGITLDIGKIITIEEIIDKKNTIHENYFNYKGDNNYFLKTSIEGVPGLVWGANIITDIANKYEAQKVSYYYTKDKVNSNFYPFNGLYNLPENIVEDLTENRIAFQEVDYNEVSLNAENPDLMLALYKNDINDKDNTIFITSDLIIHSLNILFKNIYNDSKINYILPLLNQFNEIILSDILSLEKENNKQFNNYTQTLKITKNYFLLCQLLLNYSNESYEGMPIEVIEEYKLIENHNGISKSLILDSDIDYSLFETDESMTIKMKSYFQLLKYLNNTIADNKIVLLLNKILIENSEIYTIWNKLNNYFLYFNGEQNNISFTDYKPYSDEYGFSIFPNWLENEKNIIDFISNSPGVSGEFKIIGQGQKNNSLIMNNLISPVISERPDSLSLDILSVLGSKSAISLITQSESNKSYWEYYSSRLNDMTQEFNNRTEAQWFSSFYESYFYLIKSIVNFEQNRQFLFTEKGKWNQKVLKTASGFWADWNMNNDNEILDTNTFNNETVTDLSFKIDKYPLPIHYIEPNLTLFVNLKKLLIYSKEMDFIDDFFMNKIDNFIDLCDDTIEIVNNELENIEISDYQNEFITKIPSILTKIIMPQSETYFDSFTSMSNIGNFKVGIGKPQRFFAAINDVAGKRVSTGYTYSYFEIHNSLGEEITQDIWKGISSKIGTEKNMYQPFWANNDIK